MAEKVVPMIHVRDVSATVDWYKSIGFTVMDTYGQDGEGLSFAILSFGASEVMFNQGGLPSMRDRREVDLYLYSDNIDETYQRLKDRVDVIEGLHNTFYGMREFIIRDCNRFWITFGEPSTFQILMNGILEGDANIVRVALDRGHLNPEELTSALVAATGNARNSGIVDLLKGAGAESPPQVAVKTLQSYVGTYRSDQKLEVNITLAEDKLFATSSNQQAMQLVAIEDATFKPLAFDGFRIKFNVERGKAVGFVFEQGPTKVRLKRVEDV